MADKIGVSKTVKITISISEELFEAIAIESNLRKMNRSRVVETMLRENERIKKNISTICMMRDQEKNVVITAGHGVKQSDVKIVNDPENPITPGNS